MTPPHDGVIIRHNSALERTGIMLTKTNTDNINIVNKKYNLIEAAKSNLYNSNKSILILNVCNNMNTFGAGFNKVIANEFPIVKENYHMLGASSLKTKLGHTQFVPVMVNPKYKNQIIVANMICQTGIISENNTRPMNYFYFGLCLSKVQEFIKQYQSKNDLDIVVYSPKISYSITGANWSFIYDLMIDVLKKPTYTIVYE